MHKILKITGFSTFGIFLLFIFSNCHSVENNPEKLPTEFEIGLEHDYENLLDEYGEIIILDRQSIEKHKIGGFDIDWIVFSSSNHNIRLFLQKNEMFQKTEYKFGNYNDSNYFIIDEERGGWISGDFRFSDTSLSLGEGVISFRNTNSKIKVFIDRRNQANLSERLRSPEQDLKNKLEEGLPLIGLNSFKNGWLWFYDHKIDRETGSILVSGKYIGNVNLDLYGDQGRLHEEKPALFLAKYNSALELIWVKTINGYDTDFDILTTSNPSLKMINLHQVKIINENEVVIAGIIRSGADINPTSEVESYKGGDDLFVTSYNLDSDDFWTYTFGGRKNKLTDCIILEDGSILVSAYSSQPEISFPQSDGSVQTKKIYGNQNSSIVKLSSSGEYLWSHIIHGTAWVWPEQLFISPNSEIDIWGSVLVGAIDVDPTDNINFYLPDIEIYSKNKTFSMSLNQAGDVIAPPTIVKPDINGSNVSYFGLISKNGTDDLVITSQKEDVTNTNNLIIEGSELRRDFSENPRSFKTLSFDSEQQKRSGFDRILFNGNYNAGLFIEDSYWILGDIGKDFEVNSDISIIDMSLYPRVHDTSNRSLFLLNFDEEFNIRKMYNMPLKHNDKTRFEMFYHEGNLYILGISGTSFTAYSSYLKSGHIQDLISVVIPLNSN